jgi:hypothetical protein
MNHCVAAYRGFAFQDQHGPDRQMAVLRLPAFLSRIAKEVGKLHAHRGKASEAAFLRNPIA